MKKKKRRIPELRIEIEEALENWKDIITLPTCTFQSLAELMAETLRYLKGECGLELSEAEESYISQHIGDILGAWNKQVVSCIKVIGR